MPKTGSAPIVQDPDRNILLIGRNNIALKQDRHKTRRAGPTWAQIWANVGDIGPYLRRRWAYVFFLIYCVEGTSHVF